MGTLVAKHYPINIFGIKGIADHTYVECGTGGRGWTCFGGKGGGAILRSGSGSTKRACRIAGRNETANINCYLLTGVCHQAANRILLPARITVRGAKGYGISEALYGPYGRTGFLWWCRSNFDRYGSVKGDIEECIPPNPVERSQSGASELESESRYVAKAIRLYGEAKWQWSDTLSRRLFRHMIAHRIGTSIDDVLAKELVEMHSVVENELQALMGQTQELSRSYADEVSRITIDFQNKSASILGSSSSIYETLFDVGPGERVILADPNIVGGIG